MKIGKKNIQTGVATTCVSDTDEVDGTKEKVASFFATEIIASSFATEKIASCFVTKKKVASSFVTEKIDSCFGTKKKSLRVW